MHGLEASLLTKPFEEIDPFVIASTISLSVTVLVGGQLAGVDKVLAKFPKAGPVAAKVALPAIAAAAERAGSQLRDTT